MNPDSEKERVISVVTASILFGLGHINIITFSVPWFLACYSFVLELVYGFVLIRT